MPAPRLVSGAPTSTTTLPIPIRKPAGPSPGPVSLRHWNQLPRFSGVRLTHQPVSPSVGAEDLYIPRRVGAEGLLLRKGVLLSCPPPLTQAGPQDEPCGERDFQQSGIVCPQKRGAALPAVPGRRAQAVPRTSLCASVTNKPCWGLDLNIFELWTLSSRAAPPAAPLAPFLCVCL